MFAFLSFFFSFLLLFWMLEGNAKIRLLVKKTWVSEILEKTLDWITHYSYIKHLLSAFLVLLFLCQKKFWWFKVNRGVTGHSGAKLKKVDLHINIDGVTIVDNKTKMILFKYPLHRISFCADDKQVGICFLFLSFAFIEKTYVQRNVFSFLSFFCLHIVNIELYKFCEI